MNRFISARADREAQSREVEGVALPAGGHPVRVRTLFISDVHLGMRGCQAELLIGFLRRHDAETIFLVGDIIEHWCLERGRLALPAHEAVLVELRAKAESGARVIYVPGNHDQLLRRFAGLSFGSIEIAPSAIHESADGRRYLVTHGDQFDVVLQHMPWLGRLGHAAYQVLFHLNTGINLIRRGLGLGYWSLSAWAKRKVKGAMNYIGLFEESLCADARRHGAQGVVCGHIHHAADRDLCGIRYLNAGDWVESCTGIVEHDDGRFEVVYWAEAVQVRESGQRAQRALAAGVRARSAAGATVRATSRAAPDP